MLGRRGTRGAQCVRAACACAFAVVLFAVHTSAAQTRPAADPSRARRDAEAAQLNDRALVHFNIAAYDSAIEEFKAAYDLAPAPALLFNIAQAYRLKGACDEALLFYRNYERAGVVPTHRTVVAAHIADMEACVAKRHAPSPLPSQPPAAAPPEPASTARPRGEGSSATTAGDSTPAAPPRERPPASTSAALPPARLPWPSLVAVGGGAALGAVGLGLYLSAAHDYGEFERTCGASCPRDDWQGARTRERFGVAMLGLGAVAIAGGIVGWLLSR